MRPRPPRRPSGFTLLELLVVIAVIAVLVGISGVALQGVGRDAAEEEARRLSRLTELAVERSITEGVTLGLWAEGDEYGFLQWGGEQWVAPEAPGALRDRRLPEGVTLELDGIAAEAGAPRALFYPVGEVTPFTAWLREEGREGIRRLAVDPFGRSRIELETLE